MKLDKIVYFGRSPLRMGLLAACFLLSVCFLTGCGSEDKLLSELRQEDGPAGDAMETAEDAREDSAEGRENEARGSSEGRDAGQIAAGNGSTGQGTEGVPAEAAETAGNPAETIYVHVCGAVESPGVYELPAESRLYEAVEAAGGYTGEACEDYLNMAALLADGSRLEIPTEQEVQEREEAGHAGGAVDKENDTDKYNYYTIGGAQADLAQTAENEKNTGAPAASAEGLVNINTADVTGLCTLPGVGESRAKAIIEYRERQGGFQKKEDIMEVSGIGEKMYAKMEEYLTIE